MVPPRILIVEDNAVLAQVFKRVVASRGYGCAVAQTVQSAIEVLEMNSFDVVICDLHLGAESGIQVLKAARQLAPEARRVLMSGSEVVEACEDADMILTKPVEPETLIAAIGPSRP